MKIKRIISQQRRDFYAEMECEHCGRIEDKVSGYDDHFFHTEVIPNMECKGCGQKAKEDYRPLQPKHPEGKQL